MDEFTPMFIDTYDPLKAGSIDGTDEIPHDKAIIRAMTVKYKTSKHIPGNPESTVFVARLSPETTEQSLQKAFCEFGDVINVTIVKDIVTGYSKCYGFVELRDCYQARVAVRSGQKMTIDDHEILVESEKQRLLKGWVPRRLGGGLGGKRESGQLRFGGRDRPFSKPILYSGFSGGGKRDDGNRDKYFSNERQSHSDVDFRSNSNSKRNRSRERRRSRSRSRSRIHTHSKQKSHQKRYR